MNDAGHGDKDADRFETLDPDVGEGWAEGVFAIAIEEFAEAGDNSEEDADEAVLEDAEPNDLIHYVSWC